MMIIILNWEFLNLDIGCYRYFNSFYLKKIGINFFHQIKQKLSSNWPEQNGLSLQIIKDIKSSSFPLNKILHYSSSH